MKKTLIALAVAASAAVSGSAMAWTQNGIGGSVDFSGTLNPKDLVTPWEVKVGDGVNDLNALIKKGQSSVDVVVNKSILALGIRTASNKAFLAQPGISPQIDFKNAVDLDGFENGVTTLTLVVKDGASNDEIGTLTAPFNTGAVGSITGSSSGFTDRYTYMSANSSSGGKRGFTGGLATEWSKVNTAPQTVLNALSTEIMANFDEQGLSFSNNGMATTFVDSGAKYSAAYGAGILANDTIKIQLNEAVTGDAEIAWKAELPVTVSYQ
ncbi:TPA: hypothetical protein RLU78_003484 [Escherichia coli]|nr:hypothetical protein [Escherichia coli]HDW2612552.1 hypothetical protein [Escherichia coli]